MSSEAAAPKEGCLTCQMVEARADPGTAPWDRIVRTDHWDLVHSYNAGVLGWLVLVSRVHRDAIADLSAEEAVELGLLSRAASIALRDLTGCAKTYLAQFAEHPDHQHVHVHVVARYSDQPDTYRGPGVFGALGADPVPDVERNALALSIRGHDAMAQWPAG